MNEQTTLIESKTRQRKQLRKAQTHLKNATQAHTIVEKLSRDLQQQVHLQIASVVTKCLKIFDNPYEFRIVFERKRNQTEAKLMFSRDTLEVDPLSSTGGGVLDVGAFALRVACLVLSKPTLRRTLILDEPFRFVSANYRPAIRQLLETLSEELNIQFVMVSHMTDLQIGKVVQIE